MTVYISELVACGGRFGSYAVLTADTDVELHAVAVKLRLPRRWLQIISDRQGTVKFFEVTETMRENALVYGARYKPLADWLAEREIKTT